MNIIYRISDNSYPKSKICDKFICFKNFIRAFQNHKIYLFSDNINKFTEEFLQSNINEHIVWNKTTGLGNSGSFIHVLNFATTLKNDEMVYFVEDDYLHLGSSKIALLEASTLLVDYITLYDHPDKYQKNIDSDVNQLYLTKSFHWKNVISTTLTFATYPRVLLRDYKVWQESVLNDRSFPDDHGSFCKLKNTGAKLICCIPGQATHVENAWLSPTIDWNRFI